MTITTRAGKGAGLTNAEGDANLQHAIQCVAAGGTVDALTADYSPNLGLFDMQIVAFRSAGANTSTMPSFSPDGATARTITARGGAALLAGDIGPAGAIHLVQYRSAGPTWELLNPINPNPLANTYSGHQTLGAGAGLKLVVPTVDGTATGPMTAAYNCGYTSSAIGDLVYLDASFTWQKADANLSAGYDKMLGIALEVKASGAALLVALPGSIVYSTAFPTFTNAVVYMSETAGAVTHTAPVTADAAIRVIGWGVHADKLYFNPSPDYYTHV